MSTYKEEYYPDEDLEIETEQERIARVQRNISTPSPRICMNLNDFRDQCHAASIKWWQDPETGAPIQRNKGELICLMHSELSEAMEGVRKGLMDDKLPHRKMEEVEMVDAIIRIFDYAGGFGLDLQGAFEEKMAYNSTRADHTHEARLAAGGKKF